MYQAPPWSMKEADGQWRGLTVDLWNEVSSNLGLTTRFVEQPADPILDAIAAGTLDTAAGPFASTMERQKLLDFTHDYLSTGVGIAVSRFRQQDRWLSVLDALTTPTALRFYAFVLAASLLAGATLWLVEHKRNPMFSKRPVPGVGAGFWWAGVTTAAVGYGDKVPVTFWGRLMALLWMFISLILVTALTAFVTAHLALAELGRIQGVAGLRHAVVGSVEGSASTDFLRREDVPHRLYPTAADALAALERGEVEAVVYARETLRYFAARDSEHRFDVLPGMIEAQHYAFPLHDGSPLRDPINTELRRVLDEQHWRDLRDRYLGQGVGNSPARR